MSRRPANIACAAPFLKWAGGKRQLIPQYDPYFPPRQAINRYFEPFIGSAAVFFHLRPLRATLSDQNERLIEVYRMVQRDVEAVIDALRVHRNEASYFYRLRAQNPELLEPAERAARLIYLNKTCYNGLYRENKKGIFNVPFGRYRNPTICDETRLRTASSALQGVELRAADFDDALNHAAKGDFIYLDPPYVPLSETSNFTSYDKNGFSFADHERLAETIQKLTAKGVHIMLSNSSADLVYELYDGGDYTLIPTKARRSINSKAKLRGPVQELLILNYDPRPAFNS